MSLGDPRARCPAGLRGESPHLPEEPPELIAATHFDRELQVAVDPVAPPFADLHRERPVAPFFHLDAEVQRVDPPLAGSGGDASAEALEDAAVIGEYEVVVDDQFRAGCHRDSVGAAGPAP